MKIKKNDLLIILMTIFMIRPYYILIYEFPNRIWASSTMAFSLLALIIVVCNRKTKVILTPMILFLIYIFATFMGFRENMISAISIMWQAFLGYGIGTLFLVDKYRKSIVRFVPAICSIYLYLDILSVFTKFSVIVLHQSDTLTFLGYDNYAAFNVLALLTVTWTFTYKKKGKLTYENWICWLLCTVSKIMTGSYAATIVLILFVIVFEFASHAYSIYKIFNAKFAIASIVVLFISIYFFNVQKILAGLLKVAGKGIELNSRTIIWKAIFPKLLSIPIWGIGSNDSVQFATYFEFPYGWTATHAHNIILDLVVQTGFVGLAIFLKCISEISFKGEILRNKWYQILMIGITMYLLLGFFDFYFYLPGFWLVLSLAHSECILFKSIQHQTKIIKD